MAQKPSILAGTRDILPEVALRRKYIFSTIEEVFQKYGYSPIETPAMEKLSVLLGKYGEEGDKLIYKLLNSGDYLSKRGKKIVEAEDLEKGEKHLTPLLTEKGLRYDLTVPFARFVVMNQNELTFPFRRYQIQPVWRAERSQKGRYREFFQCDADVVGSDSLLFEAEFLAIFDEVLSKLGLKAFTIQVSNRKILNGFAEVIGQADKFMDICVAIDKLDKIGTEGVQQELTGRGIPAASTEELFELITIEGSNEEKIAFLEQKFQNSATGAKGIAELREVLSMYASFPSWNGLVNFSPTLARGLNYYTGTIYEVQSNEVKIGSIASGGRYDDLTGVFGREGLSGVGISFGADRIYDVMSELDLFDRLPSTSTTVILINFGGEYLPQNLTVLNELRSANIAAELYPDAVKLKKQFSYANKKGIPYTIMIGEEEAKQNILQLKNMESGEQKTLRQPELVEEVKIALGA
ncbi:MAG: histidine--tRNA ligase [Bacteroidota bacterium]